MILLRQVRQVLLSMGLVLFISTAIAFSFASGEGWATTSFMQGIDQPRTQIATLDQAKMITKNVEGTAEEAIGKMTSNPKDQATGKTKKLEAKTQKAINNSIENPNYQPGGRTKQAENLNQKARGDIQSEVREAFK